jgi:hypothetical protein
MGNFSHVEMREWRKRMEPEISKAVEDIHLIATPFRIIRNLVVVSFAILFAPVLLIWLVVGSHLQPQDCGIAKFLIGVFGPLVFCVWFAGVVRWIELRNETSPALGEGTARASELAAYFCGLGYVGVLLSTMLGFEGLVSLWAMVLGLFSPAIFYVLGRLFGMRLTKGLAILEVGITLFVFANGFGFF